MVVSQKLWSLAEIYERYSENMVVSKKLWLLAKLDILNDEKAFAKSLSNVQEFV